MVEKAFAESYALIASANTLHLSNVHIEGWVVADERIVEVSIQGKGRVLAMATLGPCGADIAAMFPKSSAEGKARFKSMMPSLVFNTGERIQLSAVAKTVTGKSFAAQGVIRLSEELSESGQAPSVNPTIERTAPGLGALIISPERAVLHSNGLLQVGGWFLSLNPIICLQIYHGERLLGGAQLGIERADVQRIYPEYPNSTNPGFSFSKRFSPEECSGLRSLKLIALCRGNISRSASVEVLRGIESPNISEMAAHSGAQSEFHFEIDEIGLTEEGALWVSGWSFSEPELTSLSFTLDGEEIGEIKPAGERVDVAHAHPHRPSARYSGFRFDAQVSEPTPGEHSIVVVARSESGETKTYELAVGVGMASAESGVLSPSGEPAEDFRFGVDLPACMDGKGTEVITGRFTIAGWALCRRGLAAIDVYLGDAHMGQAYHGIRREDIQAAFPEWPGNLSCGFGLVVPATRLKSGEQVLRITITDTEGKTREWSNLVEVAKDAAGTDVLPLRRKVSYAERLVDSDVLAASGSRPFFSVLIPVLGNRHYLRDLRTTISALSNQTQETWRALLVPVGLTNGVATVHEELSGLPHSIRERFEVCDACEERAFMALLSDTPNGSSEAHYVALLRSGDDLSCDAFTRFALANVGQSRADFLYMDDRRPNPVTGNVEPFLKPDWSPDLICSSNYIGRAWMASAELFRSVIGKPWELVKGGDYDAVLALTEQAKTIRHVSTIGMEHGKRYVEKAGDQRQALVRALRRRKISGSVGPGLTKGSFRIQRKIVRPGKVSIIIPTIAAGGLIEKCLVSIREKSTYRDFEIICLDNIRNDPKNPWKRWLRENADTVVEIDEGFNWSRFNNIGAANASGDYLLFLNDDIEVIEPSWLEALMQVAQRDDVGVAGPQLLYPDGKVQHAGLFLAGPGLARHAFRFANSDDPGYFGLAITQRNVMAVTGACMLVRREVYDRVGGFNEAHSVTNNDLDFCMRCHRAGLFNVFTPHAQLYHYELVSRAKMRDVFDNTEFVRDWHDVFADGDPYFNRGLSLNFDDYSVETERLREVYAGFPVAKRSEIRRILAVKLDHIGDFVTAIPAFRRLKERFPGASLTVLAGKSAAPLAAFEPAIDEVLPFEFFHARSGLGYKGVTKKDLEALGRDLQARHFDLAIDLRKHLDTRYVLRCAGARYLAGFDRENHFPWLDFVAEWEGDPLYTDKRQHVTNDLLNLIDIVANACEDDRSVIRLADASALGPLPDSVTAVAEVLFTKPVVCVHPASGNELRQWPRHYFAELIDLLIERLGVHVVIIGGPDEAIIANAVLALVKNQDAVWSLVGTHKLSQLPCVIASADLFVGNNSGPQHLAAGLGVPTVAVHSAVVPSEEWGPLGKHAVAIRRDMSCAPCYLGRPCDCARSAACLTQISPGEVFELCRRFLALRSLRHKRVAPSGSAPLGDPAAIWDKAERMVMVAT